MGMATSRTTSQGVCQFLALAVAAVGGLLLAAASASAQPYGRPISQPFFDFDNSARFMNCRPLPYAWGFDPYLQVDGCEEDCRGGIIVHRPSSWYVNADFVPLMYDANGTFPLARVGATGTTLLTTNDLKPEFDSGGRLTIGRTFGGGCYQVEGSYLGVYSWQTDNTVASNNGAVGNLSSAFSNFHNPVIAGLDNNFRITATDFNSFNSAEFNLRTWLNVPPGPFDVQLLAGFRHLKAAENFFYSASEGAPAVPPPAPTNAATVLTQNDMYGVQLGIDFDVMISARMYIDCEVKGGIMDNLASQSTHYVSTTSPPGGPPAGTFDGSASKHCTAFFGDICLTGNWQLAPNWSMRAGYQAIFINGTALGPQNFQANNSLLRTGPTQLDHSGETIYHGPVLGVAWTR